MHPSRKRLRVTHLGNSVPYGHGMAVMRNTMDEVHQSGQAILLLLQHTPTITLTRTGGSHYLRQSVEQLEREGISVLETDRGGDLTFHGPGQLVGYPIMALPSDKARLHLLDYLRSLEQGLVLACKRLGVKGCHRRDGYTGVWVTDSADRPKSEWPADLQAKKLVAIGVGVNRNGITRHGFALNIDIDLHRYTDRMVPCGLEGRGVTSLHEQLNIVPSLQNIETTIAEELAHSLDFAIDPISCGTIHHHQSPAQGANSNGATHG